MSDDENEWMGGAMWRWEGSLLLLWLSEKTTPPDGPGWRNRKTSIRLIWVVPLVVDAVVAGRLAICNGSMLRWPWLFLLLTQHDHGAAEEFR